MPGGPLLPGNPPKDGGRPYGGAPDMMLVHATNHNCNEN